MLSTNKFNIFNIYVYLNLFNVVESDLFDVIRKYQKKIYYCSFIAFIEMFFLSFNILMIVPIIESSLDKNNKLNVPFINIQFSYESFFFIFFILITIGFIFRNYYFIYKINLLSVIEFFLKKRVVYYSVVNNESLDTELQNEKINLVNNHILFIVKFLDLLIDNLRIITKSILIFIMSFFYFKDFLFIVFLLIPLFYYFLLSSSITSSIFGFNRINLLKDIYTKIYEILNGRETITIFALENRTINFLREKFYELKNQVYNYKKFQTIPNFVLQIIFIFILLFITSFYSFFMNYEFNDLVSICIIFVISTTMILNSITSFLNTRMNILSYLPALKSVSEIFMLTSVKPLDNSTPVKFIDNLSKITISNFDISFTSNKIISLDDTYLTKGNIYFLTGTSGSGKSTFCNILLGFDHSYNGVININNYDIKKINKVSLREKIGYVSQNIYFFDGTIKENIISGIQKITDEEIDNAINYSCCHFLWSLPKQLDTVIKNNADQLSGGEKQRLAICRSLIRNPELLILDEATSALDKNTEKKIIDNIRKISKKRITIIVSHDKLNKKGDKLINIYSVLK